MALASRVPTRRAREGRTFDEVGLLESGARRGVAEARAGAWWVEHKLLTA
jgi:hypothetical protein